MQLKGFYKCLEALSTGDLLIIKDLQKLGDAMGKILSKLNRLMEKDIFIKH